VGSDESDDRARWIAAKDNPFGVRVLDLRPFVGSVVSASGSAEEAENAVSWGGDDGRGFAEASLSGGRHVACSLLYPCPVEDLDGRWFQPEAMEDKWAVFHYGGKLLGIRSWLRKVVLVGHTARRGKDVVISSIDIDTWGERFSDTLVVRSFDFLVKSHVLGQILPAPLDRTASRDSQEIARQCFGLWGGAELPLPRTRTCGAPRGIGRSSSTRLSPWPSRRATRSGR
jgi:hypothetical protein